MGFAPWFGLIVCRWAGWLLLSATTWHMATANQSIPEPCLSVHFLPVRGYWFGGVGGYV